MPALAMGVLLAGAMFYVAAVGDAIMFRTEMQNAADITSFKSAVWHARGMNIIAILNILMSFALAVFAAVRIAEIVCYLIGLIPLIGAPFASAATTLVNAEPAIHRVISPALKVVGGAQDAVSMAVPYVALADAKTTSTIASSAWPLSTSLLPPVTDSLIGQTRRRPSTLPAALPIQEDTFGKLCAKAATFVPKQIANLIERTGIPGSGRIKDLADTILDDIGGRVFGLGDGIFCQPLAGGLMSAVSSLLGSTCDAVQDMDEQAEDEAAAEEEARRQEQARPGDPPEDPEEAERRRDRRSERRRDGRRREPIDCQTISDRTSAASSALAFDARPSMVWEAAANGSLFMHNWSWVSGQPALFARDQRGVGLADGGRLGNVRPSEGATAMSEFYFDCDTEWDDFCKPDATWAPNWTARIRRFRSPDEEIRRVALDFGFEMLETLQQSVGEHASEIAGEFINKFTGLPRENALATWIGERVDEVPIIREISEKIDSVVGGLRESTGANAFLDPSGYVNPDRIH